MQSGVSVSDYSDTSPLFSSKHQLDGTGQVVGVGDSGLNVANLFFGTFPINQSCIKIMKMRYEQKHKLFQANCPGISKLQMRSIFCYFLLDRITSLKRILYLQLMRMCRYHSASIPLQFRLTLLTRVIEKSYNVNRCSLSRLPMFVTQIAILYSDVEFADAVDEAGHGTHVCGSIAGTPINIDDPVIKEFSGKLIHNQPPMLLLFYLSCEEVDVDLVW